MCYLYVRSWIGAIFVLCSVISHGARNGFHICSLFNGPIFVLCSLLSRFIWREKWVPYTFALHWRCFRTVLSHFIWREKCVPCMFALHWRCFGTKRYFSWRDKCVSWRRGDMVTLPGLARWLADHKAALPIPCKASQCSVAMSTGPPTAHCFFFKIAGVPCIVYQI